MRTVADVLRECAERYASAAKEIYDITRNPSGFGMELTYDEIVDAVRQFEAEPDLTITDATTGGNDERRDRATTNL